LNSILSDCEGLLPELHYELLKPVVQVFPLVLAVSVSPYRNSSSKRYC